MNYYIANCHFGNADILRLEPRPYHSIEEMEESMVWSWNCTIKPNDIVYILDDSVLGNTDAWLRVLRRLKGNKVLIDGGCDLNKYPPELREEFLDIKPYKEIVDNGGNNGDQKVLLSLCPTPSYKHSSNQKCVMLCGYVRTTVSYEGWEKEFANSSFQNCGHIYNVGATMPWIAYVPNTLERIIYQWEWLYERAQCKERSMLDKNEIHRLANELLVKHQNDPFAASIYVANQQNKYKANLDPDLEAIAWELLGREQEKRMEEYGWKRTANGCWQKVENDELENSAEGTEGGMTAEATKAEENGSRILGRVKGILHLD